VSDALVYAIKTVTAVVNLAAMSTPAPVLVPVHHGHTPTVVLRRGLYEDDDVDVLIREHVFNAYPTHVT